MKKSVFSLLLAPLALMITLVACDKDDNVDNNEKAHLQIRLTDDPGDYDEVWIDIRDVQINVSNDDNNGWKSLDGVRPGKYDLLSLVNDRDTLLADAYIPAGRVQQIRLILGSDNYLVKDGQVIDLETSSAQQSGLKLNIHQDVEAGLMYTLLMDFDVARSIVKTGNGKHILKPVIRCTLKSAGGSIYGVVVPANYPSVVFAINGSDTVTSSFTDNGGRFSLRGLPASNSYHVSYLTTHPDLRDSTIGPVTVVAGQVTVLDTMFLQP